MARRRQHRRGQNVFDGAMMNALVDYPRLSAVQKRGVICWHPQHMYGWPSLTRSSDGALLVVASERTHHVCPFGRIMLMRSGDNGATWSPPRVIFDSPMDDRDPTIVAMDDGELLVGFFNSADWMKPAYFQPQWEQRRQSMAPSVVADLCGDWLIRSSDQGQTWDGPQSMPRGGAEHLALFKLNGDGLACFGYEVESDGCEMYFFRSADRGRSWKRQGRVPCDEKMPPAIPYWSAHATRPLRQPAINERSLVESAPGHLIAMFRNSTHGRLMQCESRDGGQSWGKLRDTGIEGRPAHLLKLDDGSILCTYGRRSHPHAVCAVLSNDDGQSWQTARTVLLDRWDDQPDMGYPTSVELTPGEILTAYYVSRRPLPHLPQAQAAQKPGSSPEGILFCTFSTESLHRQELSW